MTSELQAQVDSLEDGRRLILQQLGQLPPDARGWRPGPDAWSSIEVVHHLALVEGLTLTGLRSSTDRPTERARWRDRVGALAVKVVFRFGWRVRMPTRKVRPDPTLPVSAVEDEWSENRDALLSHLRSLEPSRYREPAIRHPVAGPMDVLQTLTFLASHQAHHLGQLRRIRAHPDFPWNS